MGNILNRNSMNSIDFPHHYSFNNYGIRHKSYRETWQIIMTILLFFVVIGIPIILALKVPVNFMYPIF